MKKILTDWFTGKDGVTFDVGRALWFAGVVGFIAAVFVDLYRGGHFDAQAYGLGASLATGGAAIGLKAHAEP